MTTRKQPLNPIAPKLNETVRAKQDLTRRLRSEAQHLAALAVRLVPTVVQYEGTGVGPIDWDDIAKKAAGLAIEIEEEVIEWLEE